jgi:hypothetical protein
MPIVFLTRDNRAYTNDQYDDPELFAGHVWSSISTEGKERGRPDSETWHVARDQISCWRYIAHT